MGRRTVGKVRSTRSPGQRAGLTRLAVLEAARELLAERGVAELSMRALAGRLGVAPNSLYSYVASKTQLLDDLLDDLLASVEAPAPDAADAVAGLSALMGSTYALLTAHADLVPLYLSRQGARGPNAVRLGEVMDVLLARSGVGPGDVARARRVLIVHTIGSAAFATGSAGTPDIAAPLSAREARESFLDGLGWLLAGITRPT